MTIAEMIAVLGTSINAAKQIKDLPNAEVPNALRKVGGFETVKVHADVAITHLGHALQRLKIAAYDEQHPS